MQIQPVKQLRGEVSVPGDKSISHRSIMFGALAKGTTEITHFLHGADCLSTIGCFRAMGINIEDTPDRILVHGKFPVFFPVSRLPPLFPAMLL